MGKIERYWLLGFGIIYLVGMIGYFLLNVKGLSLAFGLLWVPVLGYGITWYTERKKTRNKFLDLFQGFTQGVRGCLESFVILLKSVPEDPRAGPLSTRLGALRTQLPASDAVLPADEWGTLHQETMLLIKDLCSFIQSTLHAASLHEKPESRLEKELQTLCSVHVPVEVTGRWKDLASDRWEAVSKDTLESLSRIKEMEESDAQFIQEVISQFKLQQSSYETYTVSYQENLKQYFQMVETIRNAYLRDLDASSQEVHNAFGQFHEITDIVGRVKLISLNMSIEASKVKGSKAFSLLARELRRLAEHTEQTIQRITQRFQNSLAQVEANKIKQIEEFSQVIKIIDHFRDISSQYDRTTGELTDYIHRAINQIDQNQVNERAILMQFFTNLQNIAIYKEELNHLILYQKTCLEKVNDCIEELVRKTSVCRGQGCPDRKEALDLLASFGTTDEERNLINQLYKEYLGVDRSGEHGKHLSVKEGVVLF